MRKKIIEFLICFVASILVTPVIAADIEKINSTIKYDFINVNGKSIAYQDIGKGFPIVFLHGWPQTSYVWRKVVPLLQTNYRLILIDLPGLGESQSVETFDTAHVADMISDTTKALGISSYHLVGHDVGAWVATAVALRHESELKTLTVVDAGIPGLMPEAMFKPDNAPRVWQFYFHAISDVPELLTKGRELEYLSWYFDHKTIVKDAITKKDIDIYVRSYQQKNVMTNGFGYCVFWLT